MKPIIPFFRTSRASLLNCIQTANETTDLTQADIFILITETKRRVYLVSSNGELQTQASVNHIHSFSLAVPFLVHIKSLTNILKLTISETISFVCNTPHLTIFTENTSLHIKPLSTSQQLVNGVPEECIALIVNQKILKQLLGITLDSIANHEMYPHFNICVYYRNGRLNCIALGARRMSYASANLRLYSNSSESSRAVITRSSLSELYRLLEYTNHLSKLYISRNCIRYTASGSDVICKQVIGNHPNANYILKKEYLFFLEVDRLLLVTALNRLTSLMTDEPKNVSFCLKTGRLVIRATNLTEEVVPLRIYNKHLLKSEATINSIYIIGLLTNIGFLLVNLLVEGNSKGIMLVQQDTYRHAMMSRS